MFHSNLSAQRHLTLGKELKKFREEANISIEETAEGTYLNKEEIINIEENGIWSDKVGTLLCYFYLYKYAQKLFPHFEKFISDIDGNFHIPEEH